MALRNIKVIEFGGLAPSPFAGLILRDFGADVIKIDQVIWNSHFNLSVLSSWLSSFQF